MKKFIFKLFYFLLPGVIAFTIIVTLYVILDPFKVIYHYASYYELDGKDVVTLNKDFVSTTTFIQNSENVKYNSFIFGNSRSMFYQISDWKNYLKENDNCYHFDAHGESIWAINKKFDFLDKNDHSIKNILLILDYSTLIKDKPKKNHLGIISPVLVHYSNKFDFHKSFLSAFMSPRFLYAYIDYRTSKTIKPYMKVGYLLNEANINYETSINEVQFNYFENLIEENKYYTTKRLSVFYDRETTEQKFSPVSIFDNQKTMLSNIAAITKKHNTEIKIIINPLYDQLNLNQDDLAYLKNLFGNDNVFDFSGINKFTNDYKNYYENSHYRPTVAREIMKIIYNEK